MLRYAVYHSTYAVFVVNRGMYTCSAAVHQGAADAHSTLAYTTAAAIVVAATFRCCGSCGVNV
jgi:hypothetical protein